MSECRYAGRLRGACLALTLPLAAGQGRWIRGTTERMSTSAGPGDGETGTSPSGETGASASGETDSTDTVGVHRWDGGGDGDGEVYGRR